MSINIDVILAYYDTSKTFIAMITFFFFFSIFTITDLNYSEIKILGNSFIVTGLILSFAILFFRYEYGAGRYSISNIGTAIDPNYLASFMCVPTIIALKRFLYPKSISYRLKYAVIASIILLAILLTGSRGAFLSLAVGSAILLWYKSSYSPFYLIFLIGFGMLILAFLPAELTDRFLNIYSYNDASNRVRIERWTTALNYIKEHPLFGYGPIRTYDILAMGQGIAHNSYLGIALQFGCIGLVFFLTILFKCIKYCLTKDMFLFLAILAAILITSLIIENSASLALWLPLTYICAAVNLKIKRPDKSFWELV
jgi:O-antigen ligase